MEEHQHQLAYHCMTWSTEYGRVKHTAHLEAIAKLNEAFVAR